MERKKIQVRAVVVPLVGAEHKKLPTIRPVITKIAGTNLHQNAQAAGVAPVVLEHHTITIVAGSHGTCNPEPGTVEVDHGTSLSIDIIPDEGYQLDGVELDGVAVVDPTDPYVLDYITEDHTVEITFATEN